MSNCSIEGEIHFLLALADVITLFKMGVYTLWDAVTLFLKENDVK